MSQIRNVVLIIAITAAMALATVAIAFVFDLVPGVKQASARLAGYYYYQHYQATTAMVMLKGP
ncbi:hypothetical protein [Nitrososphaera sp.]|uniref:hypothetical protein n=1 Tax=Nitrososphaera sp. TaxID=1971748 RepID=UPI00307E3F8C